MTPLTDSETSSLFPCQYSSQKRRLGQPLYDGRYDDTPASRARFTKPSAPTRPLLVAASGHAERQSGHVTAAVPLVRTHIPKHSAWMPLWQVTHTCGGRGEG